ncbi:hypothetical protein PISMIDRAFT_680700 [Pisolithus microcarpus 441]|uniref:Uncharacterized protein n=1 Tax=Pisolithus microcarpus 441 TaxID=765257 RepID=A0A0C9ZHL0_9AGAM|nr:hypothetical protein PISMIDRAFT_680700 [Pisolithus microcarpus 441]
MIVWLEDVPRTLEVGYKTCVRCRSLLESRYEDIAAKCTVTSHVSLLDAFCDFCSDVHEIYFSKRLTSTTKISGTFTTIRCETTFWRFIAKELANTQTS